MKTIIFTLLIASISFGQTLEEKRKQITDLQVSNILDLLIEAQETQLEVAKYKASISNNNPDYLMIVREESDRLYKMSLPKWRSDSMEKMRVVLETRGASDIVPIIKKQIKENEIILNIK